MSSSMNPLYIKAGASVAISAVLDRFVLGEQEITKNLYFGLATGVGVAAGSYLSSITPALLPDDASGLYTGKSVMSRVFEIGAGVGGVVVLDNYITKSNQTSLTGKLLVVFVTDFASEYLTDYLTTQPLAYLS